MKWVTRERPKIDRLACPWLIRRFIDPDAEIHYVPAAQVLAVSVARQQEFTSAFPSLTQQRREGLGHPERLESLGEHRHAPHVELIPSPKTCATNETRVHIKTIYGNHDGPPLMPPDESRVIENTGPPLCEQTAVSA